MTDALAVPSSVVCRGLTKRFVGGGDGLDLDVPAGSVFGLLGPNGAGKTTTLRLITGLARPTAGGASIDGRAVVPDAAGVRGSIGVLDQDPRYYGWMTGRELVEFAGRLQGLSAGAARVRASETLALVGLADATPGGRILGRHAAATRHRPGARLQAAVADPR